MSWFERVSIGKIKHKPLEGFLSVLKDSEASKKAWLKRQRAQDVSMSDYYDKYADPGITPEKILANFSEADRKEISEKLELSSREPSSESEFAIGGNADNGWLPERQKLHAKIIASFFPDDKVKAATPADGEAPTFIILGGRGGSGKSAFTNGKIREFDSSKFINIDSDEIKKALRPPYAGWNPALVHEESARIMDGVHKIAVAMGLNVLHDATLKSNKYEPTVKEMKSKGYKVEAHYMFVPPQESAKRGVQRYLGHPPEYKRGRLVPVEILLGMTSNERHFDSLKGMVDKWSAYDNQGREPKLIGRSGGAS